jgi:hypothetical protein
MAFRIEAAAFVAGRRGLQPVLSLVLLMAPVASAQQLTFNVRHEHFRKGGDGVLTFSAEGVRFQESGKKAEHSRDWKYSDIQRLELRDNKLRITTYDDVAWQLGRDREYTFDHLPKDMAAQLYPMLSARLDRRFVADVADSGVKPLWSVPAKMLRGRGGVNGVLQIAGDRIVFKADKPHNSKTWRFTDILTLTSSGAFQLSLETMHDDFRFQLKEPLAEDRYNELWRSVARANGLNIFHSQMEVHHD